MGRASWSSDVCSSDLGRVPAVGVGSQDGGLVVEPRGEPCLHGDRLLECGGPAFGEQLLALDHVLVPGGVLVAVGDGDASAGAFGCVARFDGGDPPLVTLAPVEGTLAVARSMGLLGLLLLGWHGTASRFSHSFSHLHGIAAVPWRRLNGVIPRDSQHQPTATFRLKIERSPDRRRSEPHTEKPPPRRGFSHIRTTPQAPSQPPAEAGPLAIPVAIRLWDRPRAPFGGRLLYRAPRGDAAGRPFRDACHRPHVCSNERGSDEGATRGRKD